MKSRHEIYRQTQERDNAARRLDRAYDHVEATNPRHRTGDGREVREFPAAWALQLLSALANYARHPCDWRAARQVHMIAHCWGSWAVPCNCKLSARRKARFGTLQRTPRTSGHEIKTYGVEKQKTHHPSAPAARGDEAAQLA